MLLSHLPRLRKMEAEDAIKEAYRLGLEEAAKICDGLHAKISDPLIIGEARADAGHNTLTNCAKAIRSLKGQSLPAAADRKDAERQYAIMESERIASADEYFKARTHLMDTVHNRRIFESGFQRGFDAAIAKAGGKEA